MPPKQKKEKAPRPDEEPPAEAKKSTAAAAAAADEATAPPAKKISRKEPSSAAADATSEATILAGTVPFVRQTKEADFDASTMLKIVSWNVASLRSLLSKSTELQKLFDEQKPDVVCLQETKLVEWKDCPKLGCVSGYTFVDSLSVTKKGYAGTRTYYRVSETPAAAGATCPPSKPSKAAAKPDDGGVLHILGFNLKRPEEHDSEGRVVATVLPAYGLTVVNSYVPNSGMALERLDYRTDNFDPLIRGYLQALHTTYPSQGVVWTGDLNVAERDYDRYHTGKFKDMQKCPGFTPQERASFRTTLAETGMVDGFRQLYPKSSKAYTFYSYKRQSRALGNGWRLDYFVVSASLVQRLVDCFTLNDYTASDHVPLVMWLRRK